MLLASRGDSATRVADTPTPQVAIVPARSSTATAA
jgi:hypothetical protein